MGLRWEMWVLGAWRGGVPEGLRPQGAGQGRGMGMGTGSECPALEHVHPRSGRPPSPEGWVY